MRSLKMNRPILVREKVVKYKKEWKHEYLCYCGRLFLTFRNFVNRGHTNSCGCNKGKGIHNHTKNYSRTATYITWGNMKQRCLNSKHTHYSYYGGRGITICERWLVFKNFLEDMGEKPIGMSIDRIDVNGNYELNNCRWADKITQANNTRRSNR